MPKKKQTSLSGVKAIAKRANVSIATVDRVLHNRKGVSEATKQKINDIIQEMGYRPNILASRLASKKSNRFLVIIPDATANEYWASSRKGVNRAAAEIEPYGITVDCVVYDMGKKKSFEQRIAKVDLSAYDGIVLAPFFFEPSVQFTAQCKAYGIPLVFINSDIPEQENLSYIGPHLYKSGYQAAHIIDYGLRDGDILIINIAKEMDTYHHLLRKEEGFRAYFEDIGQVNRKILKLEVHEPTDAIVETQMRTMLQKHPGIKGVFVTNSKVGAVAKFLETAGLQELILVGYDFITENIRYLKKGVIDFLIGQKPEEQGYIGIMNLFQHIVMGATIEKYNFMPIDIITKENYEFYRN